MAEEIPNFIYGASIVNVGTNNWYILIINNSSRLSDNISPSTSNTIGKK